MHFERKQKVGGLVDLPVGGAFHVADKAGRRSRGVMGKALAGGAFLFLLGLCYQALFPVSPSNAATDDVELELEVAPTIGMALDKTSLTLYDSTQCETGDTAEQCAEKGMLPTSSGTQVSANMNVYVTTNANGYTLKVYTLSPTNEMKHINSSVTADINPTAGQLSTLAANTWGVKYGAGNWMAVGASESSQTTIAESVSPTSAICSAVLNGSGVSAYEACVSAGTADKSVITFGANITDALPSGRYTNDVVFSVVAKTSNPVGGN